MHLQTTTLRKEQTTKSIHEIGKKNRSKKWTQILIDLILTQLRCFTCLFDRTVYECFDAQEGSSYSRSYLLLGNIDIASCIHISTVINMHHKLDIALATTVAAVVIISSVLMGLTLVYTKTLKQSTKVFLSQMTLSNLTMAVLLVLKAFFIIFELVVSVNACVAWFVILISGFCSYLTTQLFIYVDLYLTTRQMKMTPLISRGRAIVMCVFCWGGWLVICSIGRVWVNPTTYNVSFEYGHCSINREVFTWKSMTWYVLFTLSSITLTIVFYIMLLQLLAKKLKEIHPDETTGMNFQWLTKQRGIVQSTRIQLVMVVVCWGLTTIVVLVYVLTSPANTLALTDPKKYAALHFVMQIIYTAPLYSNNIIFLVTNKPLRKTVSKYLGTYCRWRRNRVAPWPRSVNFIDMRQLWGYMPPMEYVRIVVYLTDRGNNRTRHLHYTRTKMQHCCVEHHVISKCLKLI